MFFCDKAKLFLDNKVPGGLDTGEASRFVTSFFEVAGYNCGQMRAQKWFRLTDPILVPSLYLGTEIGSAGRTLNRPLQKARFTFQALLEFDWRAWMDQLTLYMTSGKVMLALLQLPAWFHYGETLVTTTYSGSIQRSYPLARKFADPRGEVELGKQSTEGTWSALGLGCTYVYSRQSGFLSRNLSAQSLEIVHLGTLLTLAVGQDKLLKLQFPKGDIPGND